MQQLVVCGGGSFSAREFWTRANSEVMIVSLAMGIVFSSFTVVLRGLGKIAFRGLCRASTEWTLRVLENLRSMFTSIVVSAPPVCVSVSAVMK